MFLLWCNWFDFVYLCRCNYSIYPLELILNDGIHCAPDWTFKWSKVSRRRDKRETKKKKRKEKKAVNQTICQANFTLCTFLTLTHSVFTHTCFDRNDCEWVSVWLYSSSTDRQSNQNNKGKMSNNTIAHWMLMLGLGSVSYLYSWLQAQFRITNWKNNSIWSK